MRVKHKEIEFRISRRILWVGEQAYPLQHITRVRPVQGRLNRGRLLVRYGREAGSLAVLAVIGVLVLACLGDFVPQAVTFGCAALALAVLALHTGRLIHALRLPTLHILSIAIAGSSHTALVSTDRRLIYDLLHRVVEAIDNPAAEYAIRVDHVEITMGDKVRGDKYGGDHIEGDKIENILS